MATLCLAFAEVQAQAPAALPSAPRQDLAALAGIVEGPVVLIRGSTRMALAEGVRLMADDIVEAPAGSHVQVEFGDGVMLGLANGARAMLQPRWPLRRGGVVPRAYVLEGWVKLSWPAVAPLDAAALALGPMLGLAPARPGGAAADKLAVAVVRLAPPDLAAFVETGQFRLVDRSEAQRGWSLAPNDYVWRAGSGKLQQQARPAGDFVAALPPPFRDALPARAARFADRKVLPRPLGDVAYAEVQPWLRGEPALRAHLVDRWRVRANDPAFRAAMLANLVQHAEWELVLFPERAASRAAPSSH